MESIRYYPGIYREVAAFASVMTFSTVLSLMLYKIKGDKKYKKLALFFTCIVFVSTLKKTILVLLVVWFLYIIYFYSVKKLINIKTGGFVFVVVLVLLQSGILQNIEQNIDYHDRVGNEGHVRIAMYITSVKIAVDHFPLGSGFGTFGSFASLINNPIEEGYFDYKFNDIYQEYGVHSLAGNGEEAARDGTLTHLDTYWPHIIAETGLIAVFLIICFFYKICSVCMKERNNPSVYIKCIYFYVCVCVISFFIEGLGLIQPEIPFYIFFISGLTGILLNNEKKVRRLYNCP
jgi:hypothetical protein